MLVQDSFSHPDLVDNGGVGFDIHSQRPLSPRKAASAQLSKNFHDMELVDYCK